MAGLLTMLGGGATPPAMPPTHGVRHAPSSSPLMPPKQGGGFMSGEVSPMTMMGLSLLAGNRPSTTPTNPWASAMHGLQAGQQMTSEREQREMQKKLYELQMAKYNQPDKPEVREVNGALMERQPDGSWKEVVAANIAGQPPKTRERYDGTTVIQEEWDPKTMKWNKVGEGMRWQPESTRADAEYYTTVSTPNGLMRFNNRTGAIEPLTDPMGNPLVKASDDPNLRGQIAGAEAKGAAEGKREYGMEGIGEILQQADDILAGKRGAKPTASGLGAAVDAAAGFVGVDPEGAKEAAQLKAIGGALTAKMPRMEGPQSDKDTLMYREMAGQIGDPTIPIERRRAALEVVKSIWAKYEGGAKMPSDNGITPMPQAAPTSIEDRLKKYGL